MHKHSSYPLSVSGVNHLNQFATLDGARRKMRQRSHGLKPTPSHRDDTAELMSPDPYVSGDFTSNPGVNVKLQAPYPTNGNGTSKYMVSLCGGISERNGKIN